MESNVVKQSYWERGRCVSRTPDGSVKRAHAQNQQAIICLQFAFSSLIYLFVIASDFEQFQGRMSEHSLVNQLDMTKVSFSEEQRDWLQQLAQSIKRSPLRGEDQQQVEDLKHKNGSGALDIGQQLGRCSRRGAKSQAGA